MPRMMAPAKPKVNQICYFDVICCSSILKIGIAPFFKVGKMRVMKLLVYYD